MRDGGHDLDLAQAHLRDGTAGMVDALSRLIAVDTSFPPGLGYGELADVAEALFAPLGFSFERIEVPETLWQAPGSGAKGSRVNLIARRRTGLPACSIYFHTDVVPAGDDWTRPAFELTHDGNRLFGRGTADMKGTIASVYGALAAADKAGVPLGYDPVLLFCTDEEGGLYPGIRYLAETGAVEGHLLSFNGQASPRIWGGCFGSLDLAIEIVGRSAHSGEPSGGINAIEVALPLLDRLMDLKREVEMRVSAMVPPPFYPAGNKLSAKLTIAAINAGAKGSSLPGTCRIVINRRYTPEEDGASVESELRDAIDAALKDSGALDWTVQVIGHLAPVDDPSGPHWLRWQAALAEGFGYKDDDFVRYGSSTSSDMGWVQQAGIREILLGGLARPDSRIHAADEFTTTDDLQSLAHSVLAYLAAPFRPDLQPEFETNQNSKGEQR
ncbi:MAG: M20/M25/M40 family metallo-hydrolase [Pseudomonadota bacterium]